MLAIDPFSALLDSTDPAQTALYATEDVSVLATVAPLGSLIYGLSIDGSISTPGEVDDYEIDVDVGQTITVVVDPIGSPQVPRVLITEIGTAIDDYFEIQNVSGSQIDTTGWFVAVNDASDTVEGINAVTDNYWSLPTSMAAGALTYADDSFFSPAPHKFGAPIQWNKRDAGWAMVLDGEGQVIDFVAWGYTEADIAGSNIVVNGFPIAPVDLWTGMGVQWSGDSSETSLVRSGNTDSHDAGDFAAVAPGGKGQQNSDLLLPFVARADGPLIAKLNVSLRITGPGVATGWIDARGIGLDEVIQTEPVATGGTFTVEVSGSGGTRGPFSGQVILGAAVEEEQHDGPTNDDASTAQSLADGFIPLAGSAERGAVLGALDSAVETIYQANMDADPGWVLEGDWQYGQPTGGGSSNHDPVSGSTGLNVIGYNLLGDYPNYLGVQYATTPSFSTAGATGVTLSFMRWLGIESSSFDHATIEVSNDAGATWTTVWDHTGLAISDSSWTPQTFDISAIADNRPDVRIRWSMGPTDSSVTYPGWNIDDVVVSASVPIAPDWYRFELGAGQSATLVLSQLTGTAAVLDLFDSTGVTQFATGRAANNVAQVINNFVAPATGTYLARVSGADVDYSLIVTRNSDFDTEPNDTGPNDTGPNDGLSSDAQHITSSGVVLGHVIGNEAAVEGSDDDYYTVNVNAGDSLAIETFTPGDGPWQPDNSLDPGIELYRVDFSGLSGTLIPHINVVGNETLAYTAVDSGLYTIRVFGEGGTRGEYVLQVSGHTGALAAMEVTNVNPPDGSSFAVAPTEVTIDFNHIVDLSSLAADDLKVNGVSAVGLTIADSDTATFDITGIANDGVNDVTIADGAISNLQGTGITAFSSQFTVDVIAPRVIGSSIQEGSLLATESLTYWADFDEELNWAALDALDVSLVGARTGWQSPTDFLYDPTIDRLTLQFADLEDDSFTLTLFSGDGAFEDLAGNDLDGEPLGPNVDGTPTGDGTPGGDYTVQFFVDRTSPLQAEFERIEPLGGLMSISRTNSGLIHDEIDVDSIRFFAEAGRAISVVASPDDPAATITVELVGLTPPTSAPGAGESAVLQAVAIPANGFYELSIRADARTPFEVDLYLGATVEATDTADGSESAIDASFVSLGSGRLGVVGSSSPNSFQLDSTVWGVQPDSGSIILIDPVTGNVFHSFAAPDALASGQQQIGLSIAEGGATLIYVNSDNDPTALYRLDPTTGEVLSIESTNGGLVDGLGFDGDGSPITIYEANMDVDPGWVLEGGWQYGQPTGGGSSSYDPVSGFTGLNVVGYNLFGDYPNSMGVQYATTPSFSTLGVTGATLSFMRWLGVEDGSYDHAAVEVSNDAGTTWTTVWDHTSWSISESSWTPQTFDISAIADNRPEVRIRWSMGPTDGSVTYPGWNIDDVTITAELSGQYIFLGEDGESVHRQETFSGPEVSFWATGSPTGGLGGDGSGRQFGFFTDGLIHEYDPMVDTDGFLSAFAPPAMDIEGMAFDGTDLYVSTASGDLYTLDPDTGAVHSTIVGVPGGPLYGLGARRTTGGGAGSVAEEPNDTIAEAVPSGLPGSGIFADSGQIGDNPNLSLEPGLDVDMIEITLDAGDRVTIDVDADEIGSSLDSMLLLFDSFGLPVGYSDDDPAPGEPYTFDPYIDFTASVSDTYYLGVSGFFNVFYDPFIEGSGIPGSTGTYSIAIQVNPALTPLGDGSQGNSGEARTDLPPAEATKAALFAAMADGKERIDKERIGKAPIGKRDFETRDSAAESWTGPANTELDDFGSIALRAGIVIPDIDEYTIDLTGRAGESIDLVLAGHRGADFFGELMELLAVDGVTVLATASPDPLGGGIRAENFDLAILDFTIPDSAIPGVTVPGDGVYTIRVTSAVEGDYGLVVTDSLMFDTEPNDQVSGPLRSLDDGSTALGYLGSDFLELINDELFIDSSQIPKKDDILDVPQFYLPPGRNLFAAAGFLTAPAPGADPLTLAIDFLTSQADALGLVPEDLINFMVTDRYVSSRTGVTHIYLRQTLNSLEIVNADINVNITADGRIINVGSSFVSGLSARSKAVTFQPAVSAADALAVLAGEFGWSMDAAPELVSLAPRPGQSQMLTASGISLQNIPARQHYVPTPDGSVELAWLLNVQTVDQQHWYDASVGTQDGGLLYWTDWVDAAEYNVFALPVESPSHGTRTNEANPDDPIASPFGWHDTDGLAGAEFNTTRGNNVYAYADRSDDNASDGFDPDGGAMLAFDFAIDFASQPDTYQEAAVTNLFYWNNVLHDVHYRYGFDEAAGNFQSNNYGNGGSAGDAVDAEAQDGADVGKRNNANFATPPDGSAPRMQMYLWDTASPELDGDFDNGIIIHEYGHGVSNRLTGGPGNANALGTIQSGGMGEGWSDWWALMLTQVDPGSGGPGPLDGRGIGTYALNEPTTGAGIRTQPYSVDRAVNDHTFDDIRGSNSVHFVGEIWATTLWDLNWMLIQGSNLNAQLDDGQPSLPAPLGFNPDFYDATGTEGNIVALNLVMEGLKLQPANPSMLDARDAILAADRVLYGGANQLTIWTAFARRGMGFSADDGGSSASTNVTGAIDLPATSEGTVVFGEDFYEVGDAVTVQVRDLDLTDGGPITADVTSSNGDTETLSLVEVGLGIFEGTVASATSASVTPGNGTLEVGVGDTITVAYEDADDGTGNPATVTDDATFLVYIDLFRADFSNAAGDPFDEGFTVSGPASEWHLSVGRGADSGHSPDDSFYFGSGESPSGGGAYGNNADDTITSLPVDLTGFLNPQLTFNHFLQVEAGWDFATVSVRDTGGSTVIATSGGQLPASTDGFEAVTLDLSAYAGQQIQIEFRLTSDELLTYEGWYVDDIAIRGGIDDPTLLGPRVANINPSDTLFNQTFTEIVVEFNEPITITSATDAANYELLEAGPDNELGTADDVVLPFTPVFDGTATVTLEIDPNLGPLAVGSYQLTIDGDSSIEDLDGNPLGSTTGPDGGSDHVHRFTVEVKLPSGGDLYTLDLLAGEAVRIWTETPLDDPAGSPLNDLNPALGVYDAIGLQLAADLGSLDGKNADLVFVAPENGTYFVRVYAEEGSGEYLLSGVDAVAAEVVGRHVFYNNSTFDGENLAANEEDDNAIAPDKIALLPGSSATFANYTSYDKGINGIMVDIAGLADPDNLSLTGDFAFQVSRDGNSATWTTASVPSGITVRSVDSNGDGIDDFDRISIVWPDNAIEKQWLQVTVKATNRTGLLDDDVFYFGNVPGEAGNNAINTIVNATDEIAARNFQHGAADPASIDDAYDYNRDGLVDGTDQIIARNNQTNPLTMLRLIEARAVDAVIERMADREVAEPEASAADLDWLYEFEHIHAKKQTSSKSRSVEATVDRLLATDWS